MLEPYKVCLPARMDVNFVFNYVWDTKLPNLEADKLLPTSELESDLFWRHSDHNICRTRWKFAGLETLHKPLVFVIKIPSLGACFVVKQRQLYVRIVENKKNVFINSHK